ncbi:hypothetical protein [Leptothrix discophora]|uniref:Apea-like HEPN domain-containing protein n=1 Tax=Leptothrix discophora TaxID=89 RepID=A0ABT9G5M0_LEPDI|nr:hypothetical protein [Leptothrix discophora]MDP4301547.1 hypothetical protein [Leptothrix discophora]
MHELSVSDELRRIAFEFFYRFSRLEFALKENGYVRRGHRNIAEVNWWDFSLKFSAQYSPTDSAIHLLKASPKRQIISPDDRLEWEELTFPLESTSLWKMICLLKAVRNNLFHGGKHAPAGWLEPERTHELLVVCISVIVELADLAGIQADFDGRY